MAFPDISIIRTDVTSVTLLNNYIYTGIGGCLHIFDKTDAHIKKIVKIFNGQKIYGIVPNTSFTEVLIYGGKEIKIFSLDKDLIFEEIVSYTCNDWILQAKWVDNDKNIVTIFMHNIIICWTKEMKLLHKVICEEKCILYSAHLAYDTWDDLIVLSGTVFSEILIWWPAKFANKEASQVLCRLTGHAGVIFSIDYNTVAGCISSSSDDRSVRLWEVAHKDLLTELKTLNTNISLKLSLFNHSARVFKCKLLDNYIVSAGEDSVINVWDLCGNLLRKIDAHQNACVWSMDCCESDNLIVSGGGDCGVTVFPLHHTVFSKDLELKSLETPKRIAILSNGDVVSISEKGCLEYYCFEINNWTIIKQHDDLKSYALLEVSPCRNFLALAGFQGTVYIYKKTNNTLTNVCSYTICKRSRIFSFHWLSSTSFLTCSAEGVLDLWEFNKCAVTLSTRFSLPASKERWTTAACKLGDENIVVGDRKGNIFLYFINSPERIQIVKKAHNYLGITDLHFKNNELISLGRNSVIRKYHFDEIDQKLSFKTTDKLPFTWLSKFYQDGNIQLILAFLSTEFIIWDYKRRRILLQFPCGGGHRSWDFCKQNNEVMFAYIKDKRIVTVQFNWNSLYPKDLIDGYHISEINSMQCFNFVDNSIVVSGGEDTTLRISKFSFDDPSFINICTLKSHLSSIRSVTSCKILTSFKGHDYLIVSAGGRAQIVLWNLNIDTNSNVVCSEKFSYYEQIINSDSETRIMDLCLLECIKHTLLIAACSDGLLKLFLINTVDFSLIHIGNIFYALKCILKISYINIQKSVLVVSMATDGQLVFWNFTKLIKCIMDGEQNPIELQKVIPLSATHCIKIHQSGINSFACKVLNDDRCLILTGGDDNAISLNLLKVINDRQLSIEVESKFCNVSAHCAQITGVAIFDDFFLTTSIDQKLNIFKWRVINDKLNCIFLRTFNSSVADIKGMQCFTKNRTNYIYLYGKGVEILKC